MLSPPNPKDNDILLERGGICSQPDRRMLPSAYLCLLVYNFKFALGPSRQLTTFHPPSALFVPAASTRRQADNLPLPDTESALRLRWYPHEQYTQAHAHVCYYLGYV